MVDEDDICIDDNNYVEDLNDFLGYSFLCKMMDGVEEALSDFFQDCKISFIEVSTFKKDYDYSDYLNIIFPSEIIETNDEF